MHLKLWLLKHFKKMQLIKKCYTRDEHFQRWHGGNYQNETHGVPNNINFKEEF